MKAFETEWNDTTCIVFADTVSQARYTTLKSAREAGYDPKFLEVSGRRAKNHDQSSCRDGTAPKPRKCYGEDQLIKDAMMDVKPVAKEKQ